MMACHHQCWRCKRCAPPPLTWATWRYVTLSLLVCLVVLMTRMALLHTSLDAPSTRGHAGSDACMTITGWLAGCRHTVLLARTCRSSPCGRCGHSAQRPATGAEAPSTAQHGGVGWGGVGPSGTASGTVGQARQGKACCPLVPHGAASMYHIV